MNLPRLMNLGVIAARYARGVPVGAATTAFPSSGRS